MPVCRHVSLYIPRCYYRHMSRYQPILRGESTSDSLTELGYCVSDCQSREGDAKSPSERVGLGP
jgi:hypothetical protein